MSNRWLYSIISLLLAAAIVGRLHFALNGDSPMHVSRRVPGGEGGLYIAHGLAVIILISASAFLIRKATAGLLLFVLGIVCYMWSNDISYAAGSFPLLIILAAFALLAHRRESNSNNQASH